MEHNRLKETKLLLVESAFLALALVGCAPPAETKAYYQPFTDTIVYQETPEASTIIHEETHKLRANSYESGRIGWGLRYMFDKEFSCDEEMAANKEAGIYPLDDHTACK